MRVLGIESSCDETAAAVVGDGPRILSNVVHTQVRTHARYGGIVPEIASREHVTRIVDVVDAGLDEAGGGLDAIDAVAVTLGPGLIGSLLVGVQFAKGLAIARDLPWIGINHIEGHLAAALLSEEPPPYPHTALVVSGGHTHLYRVDDFGEYTLLGGTRDDAAGEAFDKVAKILGLGYPGGQHIERIARGGDVAAIDLPRGIPNKKVPEFSFSGLKTAAADHLRSHGHLHGQHLRDFCASLQEAICDILTKKAVVQAKLLGLPGVVLAGGVAANGRLRQLLAERCAAKDLWAFAPPKPLCTDNAAMIAAAGWMRLRRGEHHRFSEPVRSRWPLGDNAQRGALVKPRRVRRSGLGPRHRVTTPPPPDPRQLMRRAGLRAKKSWGQNFLRDQQVLRDMAAAAAPGDGTPVVELGAGLGALTYYLVLSGAPVYAVERDRDIVPLLREALAWADNLTIIEDNAAVIDWQQMRQRVGIPPVVAGNLPYQLSSRILVGLADAGADIVGSVLMVQKEVAERLAAAPGGRDYGLLTVLVRRSFDVEIVRFVPPTAFVPRPKVQSAIVALRSHDRHRSPSADARTVAAARAAFAQRRKTLRNSIAGALGAEPKVVAAAVERAGLDPGARAETLDLEQFAALGDALSDIDKS